MNFPLHLHSQLEIYYLDSGIARVQVQQEVRVMHAGEIAVIFPNQIHSYQALEDNTECTLMICDIAYTGGYAQTLLNFQPQNAFVEQGSVHADVRYAINALNEEKQENSAVIGPLVQLILARMFEKMRLERNNHSGRNDLTNQLVQYIAQHFREPITLSSLARSLDVSKYHLSHLFSERIGVSFPTYLSGIRLSYACSKLRESALTVTEVAMDAGFESQRTFFRVFMEQLGITPSQYRKNAQLGMHAEL